MRRSPRIPILLLLALGLAACGTKGPLVLPAKSAPEAKPAAAAPADDSKGVSSGRQ